MSLEKEYAALAASYDSRWARYNAAAIRRICSHFEPGAGGRLLDVGCGTGLLLQALAARDAGLQLYGIDKVAEMLLLARQRLPLRIHLQRATIEALPFSAAQFDTVISSSMFHYVCDPKRALSEVFRVLRPGGKLILVDWCADFLAMRLLQRYLRATNKAHHKTYSLREITTLLKSHGCDIAAARRYKINWFWGLMTIVAKTTNR
jgi:ubiquinone/menaquinone biosynthesis C-methylase UbiE